MSYDEKRRRARACALAREIEQAERSAMLDRDGVQDETRRLWKVYGLRPELMENGVPQ